MPILSIAAFLAEIPCPGRLMGCDVGDKTIGIAACDPMQSLAMPLETLRRGRFAVDAVRIGAMLRERDTRAVVVGLPVSPNGEEGPRCQSARQFARNLEKELGSLSMLMWDERMSTAAVQRVMIEDLDMRRDRRAEIIDAHAAAYILQGVLDALANLRRSAVESIIRDPTFPAPGP